MSPPVTPEDLTEKIRRLLALRNGAALRRLLTRSHFADIAEVMEHTLAPEEAVTCFQLLNIGQAAQVLTSLSEDRQIACLSSLPTLMSSKILRVMAADDAVDILQELDTEQSRKILGEMPFDTETRTLHNLLLEEPDTAAGLMSTNFIQTSVEGTVGDAMNLIRRAEEKDFIYYCYLVDAQERLVGVVSLKQLILHEDSVPLQRIATFDIKSILLSYDQELVVNLFRKYYNLLAMPVVDNDDALRGIITLDDIIYVIDEESSEDIYRASGINLEEMDEKNLLSGPMINAVKARLPWLSVTVVGQFLAATIIASFQETVSSAVIAVSFMPLLSGLAGNMGTQSDTIAVRGLALNLITADNFWGKFQRELRVALTTGIFFALAVGLLSFFQYRHWELSLLLFVAILVGICLSASLGMLLPFLVQKIFKQDPAGIGGPFVTTLLDILTFTTYLYVVSLFLSRMI